MSRRHFAPVIPALLALTSFVASAHVPDFSEFYLVSEWGSAAGAEILLVPEVNFGKVLDVHTGLACGPLGIPTPDIPLDFHETLSDNVKWRNTLAADTGDLWDALMNAGNPDINAIITHYVSMRQAMKEDGTSEPNPALHYMLESYQYGDPPPREVPTFSIARYGDLLENLPAEFRLYVLGAVQYRAGDPDSAICYWDELLSLPAEQRHYRAVWAAYMLGRAWTCVNASRAIEYFELCRSLAQTGFQDSAGLALESKGWQARAEADSAQYVLALHHYYDAALAGAPMTASIFSVLSKALTAPVIAPDLILDPDCRNLVTAAMESMDLSLEETDRIAAAFTAAGLQVPPGTAGRTAMRLYCIAKFDAAERWVMAAGPDDPMARWIHAKLLVRAGKMDEALALIRSVLGAFPESALEASEKNPGATRPDRAYSEAGLLLLARRDYVNALDLLLKGGYWEDVAYVAERVLTVDELKHYLETAQAPPDRMDLLRYLFAKRLARQQDWHAAAPLYPEHVLPERGSAKSEYSENDERFGTMDAFALRPSFMELTAELVPAQNAKLPPREQAEHLFNAGKMLRERGMALFGTETAPDWAVIDGEYELGDPGRITEKAEYLTPEMRTMLASVLFASEDEKQRYAASAPKWNERFHYRYYAAELMWQCAKLLPDNDPLTAKALWSGGTYLKSRDAKAADKFYQALLNRCSGLAIAPKANKLHWFPPELKDEDLLPAQAAPKT